jgi:hypothetical protein
MSSEKTETFVSSPGLASTRLASGFDHVIGGLDSAAIADVYKSHVILGTNLEHLTGKGHTFRVAGANDWVALFVDSAQ